MKFRGDEVIMSIKEFDMLRSDSHAERQAVILMQENQRLRSLHPKITEVVADMPSIRLKLEIVEIYATEGGSGVRVLPPFTVTAKSDPVDIPAFLRKQAD